MSQVVVKRFFGKKRGSRNTRSDKLGGASLAVFFALFFLAGCTSLGLILHFLTIPDWRANFNFLPTTCVVLDKGLGQETHDGDTGYRPDIKIAYVFDDARHEVTTYDATRLFSADRAAAEAVLARYHVGQQYPCWYDPLDLRQAVLVRGHNWFAWIALVLPASLLAIGTTGLVYALFNWNKSTERRAVLAQRAADFSPFDVGEEDDEEFPTVPRHGHLVNSPGTQLRYRLPLASPSWAGLALVLTAICWNLPILVFAVFIGRGILAGTPDWTEALLLLPFMGIGIAIVVVAIRRVRSTAGVGPTIVEIDQHPLYPGGRYQLCITQGGQMTLDNLRVLLICQEEVRYVQGTNLRTARQRVVEVELFHAERVTVDRAQPWEMRVAFDMPATAMHSFQANHNRIAWELVIEAEVARRAKLERVYAISVFPPAAQPSAREHEPLRAVRGQHA